MNDIQKKYDALLDKEWTIPIEIVSGEMFPKGNSFYEKLQKEIKKGFRFTARELLHAIGCKTASLPKSYKDEALKASYLYYRLLNLENETICLKNIDEPDLIAPRIQEIGIGMTCLVETVDGACE